MLSRCEKYLNIEWKIFEWCVQDDCGRETDWSPPTSSCRGSGVPGAVSTHLLPRTTRGRPAHVALVWTRGSGITRGSLYVVQVRNK